jgi:hypothetical protein
MAVNIQKVALVNLPYTNVADLADKIRMLWAATYDVPTDAGILKNIDEPFNRFLMTYSGDVDASTQAALREFREDYLKGYQLHKIMMDVKSTEILALQNNIHDRLLIVIFNVNNEEAGQWLVDNGFQVYQVSNPNQADIIKQTYPEVSEADRKILSGSTLSYDPVSSGIKFKDQIIITDDHSVQLQALKIIQNLISHN